MLLKLEDIRSAQKQLYETKYVRYTPCIELRDPDKYFGALPYKKDYGKTVKIHLKLETSQTMGSFKIRGTTYQILRYLERRKSQGDAERSSGVITMSAGNYGRAMSFLCREFSVDGMVVMPEDAPASREHVIRGYGAKTVRYPVKNLHSEMERLARENRYDILHSYDDLDLMTGHASLGCEVFEQVPDMDCLVVCCGGAGLISGTSAAVKLLSAESGGRDIPVFAAQPEGNASMAESLRQDKAVGVDKPHSIATGLSAPYIGAKCFEVCRETLAGCLLVSDDQLRQCMTVLYEMGLAVEPAGAAALTAVLCGQLPASVFQQTERHEVNVVCVLTGGNLSPTELAEHIPNAKCDPVFLRTF